MFVIKFQFYCVLFETITLQCHGVGAELNKALTESQGEEFSFKFGFKGHSGVRLSVCRKGGGMCVGIRGVGMS